MTVSTSVPALTFTSTGVSAPTEAEILTGVQADINTAFGGNLNQNLNTPQGQIASSQTAIIGDVNDNFLYFVNQIDPANAKGSFQDAIGRIYGLTRIPAQSTIVTATCIGIAGTTIPAGSQAQDTSGNTYTSNAAATIGVNGSVDVEFQNVVAGPIACAAGTLTIIVQQVVGWDSITNASSGTIGRLVESQQDFEYRRQNSVGKGSGGTCGAVLAAVLGVTNVVDAYVIDNPKGVAVAKGATNYLLNPHSIYIGVFGGASSDIANAIHNVFDSGCDMMGNTTYTVSDSVNYQYPYPTWDITYNIPTQTPVYFKVSIKNSTSLPTTIITDVKNAIIDVFNGTSDPSTKMHIGESIFASRFYTAVQGIAAGVYITAFFLGTSVSPTDTVVNMGIDQYPTVDASNITVLLV